METSIKATLLNIKAFQQLVREIDRCKKDKQSLELDARTEADQLQAIRSELEKVHKERLDVQKKADTCELRIREAEEEKNKLQLQLNAIRHQKEYDVVRSSILSRDADIQKWEDAELTALEAVDGLRQKQTALEEKLRQDEASFEQSRKESAQKSGDYQRQIEALERKVADSRAEIAPDILKPYDRLARQRRGDALAEVRGMICQGCHTTISHQTVNELLRDKEVIYCTSCNRMLILAD